MKKISLICLFIIWCTITLFAQRITYTPGRTLSNITLQNVVNGKTFDFKSQTKAKGFIVVFMTPTCDHCIIYKPKILALDAKYKSLGYPVVAIGPYADYPNEYPLDAAAAMKKAAISGKYTFPYLGDSKFQTTTLFGITKTPTAVILERKPDGFLVKYIGVIDNQPDPKKTPTRKFVEEEIQKMLK
ncbi:MAG: redoxin domain-containing protein [Pedobacter sp.]|nr:MAG: redoxin domain-containing protein [Pedobacter sp.]